MGGQEILKYVHHLFVATTLAAIFILWVQPAAADEIRLSSEEIKRVFTNKCLSGANPRSGADLTVCMSADGTAVAKWDTGGRTGSDKGRWHVKDDMICSRWKKLRDGLETCNVVKRSGGILKTYNKDGHPRNYYTKITDYK